MNIWANTISAARFEGRFIIITIERGIESYLAVTENPRLAAGSPAQLQNIEISPFGLHWPGLDEDLSIRGLVSGDHGRPAADRTI